MKYKYLLFDLDGTLTDPMEGITTSVQYALKAFGIEEPDLEKLAPFIGPPLRESFMRLYGFDEAQAEEAVAKYREWFAPKGIFQNTIYPGIREMLEELKTKGKILAVASSKPQVFVEKILRHFGIYDYFTVIVGSELDGTRDRKEEVVEEALRRLWKSGGEDSADEVCMTDGKGLADGAHMTDGEVLTDGAHMTDGEGLTDEAHMTDGEGLMDEAHMTDGEDSADRAHTVMTGDRKYDIEGGKAHGLVTVGVSFGYAGDGELESTGADYLVDTVEELRRLLAQ